MTDRYRSSVIRTLYRSTMNLPALFVIHLTAAAFAGALPADLSVSAYPSIQAALDANPGRMIFVPAGDYPTMEKVRIHGDNAGLFGPGRIIASNPEQPILEVEHASFAQVRDLTLTRAEGKMESRREGLLAFDCRDLVIENVRVLENHSPAGAITVRESKGTRISHCLVRNYTCISIDDRTASKDLYGYAFRCIDGTGISVSYSTGSLIEGNRVEETNLRPTQAIKEKFGLGKFTKKVAEKPPLMNQKTWDAEYVDNWHQGSGIVVNAPSVTDQTRLIGNHVQNAAQGIDLHCDHIIVSHNIVDNAFIGMKAMHGSRNVLITGNQFLRNDLWAIGLMPGAASTPENSDGGSIIANNIISEFGKGDAHWIWGDGHSPFKFDHGQKVENPALMDVVIQGNVVDCIGKPLYKYVVIIEDGSNGPRGMHFYNNVFHPGTAGVANVELQP